MFHDGTPFNAAAVKFNIERILDPATRATQRAAMTPIASVEPVDDHTVRFNLKSSWGAAFEVLADPRSGGMSSPAAIQKFGKDYAWNPCGTGPFVFKEAVTGTSVHLVRNDRYWDKDDSGSRLPYLAEVTVKAIKDETVLTAALSARDVDAAAVPYKDVTFEKNAKFRLIKLRGTRTEFSILFNNNLPPLDDLNARLAIAHAIDPEVINRAVFYGRAVIADSGFWPVGTWIHSPEPSRPHFDIDKARYYLKRSRTPDGFDIDLLTYQNPVLVTGSEIVRAQLSKIGIRGNIKVMDVSQTIDQFFSKGAFPLHVSFGPLSPAPSGVSSTWFSSKGFYNPSKLNRPDIDAMIVDAEREYDTDRRKAIYTELNAIVLREAWNIPLIYGVATIAAAANIQNLDTILTWDAKWNAKRIWFAT